jgi:molybdopterin-synthase adenylyltransferase
MLSQYDRARYARQMLVAGWGEEGQQRLKQSTVFIAGAGGLGSPAAIYLAVAGVGHLIICDIDVVELSNLNRQILHADARIGQEKAESAARTLRAMNPSIEVTTRHQRIEEGSVAAIAGNADIVVDCLDNYETRFVLNDYAIGRGVPMVHGAIWGLDGQVTFLRSPETPCLRCLVPTPPAKTVFPVVGATPGLIGSIQAMEVLKYLTGVGQNLKGRLLVLEGEDMTFSEFAIRRLPGCPACSHLA